MKHLFHSILSLWLLGCGGCIANGDSIEHDSITHTDLWVSNSGFKMTEFCNQDCQLRWYELSLPAANTSILASCLEYEDSPYSLRRCDTAARVEHPWIAETYRCLTDIKRSEPDQDRLEVCTPQDTAETRVLARWLTERYATCDAGHLAPKHLASQLAWFDPDFLEVGRICARLESCEELTACIAPWEAIAMNKALP